MTPFAHPPRAGELLVAAADTGDPRFAQSVVYLLDCDEGGCLGVVLNRFADADLDEVLPQWSTLVAEPRVLFQGGPMSPNGAVCVARVADRTEEPPGWRPVSGDIGLLHLDTPVELADGAYSALRIFAGYAGWEPGQLEQELLRGGWHRTIGRPEEVFAAEPEGLWRRVLRRMGGTAALFSTWADDADLN